MSNFILPHKTVGSYKYFKSFPDSWIDEESLNNIGPRYCSNCKYYGSINDIFIGYCLNCANHVLKGKRGSGMSGNESNDFDFTKCPYMSQPERSKLKKMIFNINIKKMREVHNRPTLSRNFASDLEEYGIFRYDERHLWNYGYPDKPDSIS